MDDDPTRPYQVLERSRFQTYNKKDRYTVLGESPSQPNLTFGKLLAMLNMRRVINQMQNLGDRFNPREFAKAIYCPMPEVANLSFTDPDRKSTTRLAPVSPIDPDLKRVMSANGKYVRKKRDRLNKYAKSVIFTPNYPNDIHAFDDYLISLGFTADEAPYVRNEVEESARLARIDKFMKPLGVEVRDWSLVGAYSFVDGAAGPETGMNFDLAFDKPFLDTFFPADDDLKSLVALRRGGNGGYKDYATQVKEDQAICDYLAR